MTKYQMPDEQLDWLADTFVDSGYHAQYGWTFAYFLDLYLDGRVGQH